MKSSLRGWQIVVVALLASLNAYAIADGIRYGSIAGIGLALASLVTLGACIRLFKHMNKSQAEAEEEL